MYGRKSYLAVMSFGLLVACSPQSTPSMMNTSRVELQHQIAVQQIPVQDVSDVTLALIADDYARYGSGPLDLAILYDPQAASYTAMKARNQLRDIEKNMRGRGVASIRTRTMPMDDARPSLVVSYETYQARAPSDCHTMPGIDSYETTRDIAQYRFGCSTESLLARQIARPADLMGRGGDAQPADGRRNANIIEEWRNYGPSDANRELERIGREELSP